MKTLRIKSKPTLITTSLSILILLIALLQYPSIPLSTLLIVLCVAIFTVDISIDT